MHRDTEFDAPGGARVRCSSTAFTEMLRMDAISRFVSVCLSRIGITRCSQIDRTDAARRGDHRDHAIVEPVIPFDRECRLSTWAVIVDTSPGVGGVRAGGKVRMARTTTIRAH